MLVTNWKGGIVAVVVVVVVDDNVVGAAVCSHKSESKKTLRLSHSTGLHRDEKNQSHQLT